MNYQGITFQNEFSIEQLFSLHYFEYMSTFSFQGESHDFWEFVCVDKGIVTIGAGDNSYTLETGDIAFHQPNEFHWVKANGSIAPNLIVISFACHSPYMEFFKGKILQISNEERGLLAQIIVEARQFLAGRLDDPYQDTLKLAPSFALASGQMIKICLEQLLILLYRRYHSKNLVCKAKYERPHKTTRMNNDTEIFNEIVCYLQNNLAAHVTVQTICQANQIGRSQLQKIFSSKTGLGVIEYYSKMKIDAAMQLIRCEQLNFTQISDSLGYSSLHYFSRQFKKITGMSPSEYAFSIKAMADRDSKSTNL